MPKQQSAPLPAASDSASVQALRAARPAQSELSKLIRREMRRADRTRIPLSLVLFRIGVDDGIGASDAARLWAIVLDSSRETDVPVRIDPGVIVVVLLDTDGAGADAFLRKILSRAQNLSPMATTQQYPGPWFDALAAGELELAPGAPGSSSVSASGRQRLVASAAGKPKGR
jgi:hypothetical protein